MTRSRRAEPLLPLLLVLSAAAAVHAKVPKPVQTVDHMQQSSKPTDDPSDTTTAAPTCQQPSSECTRLREAQKQLQISLIKAHILQKLGMEQAPNMTGRKLPVVSDALIQVYMQQQEQSDMLSDGGQRDQQYMAYEGDDDHSQMEKMWTFSSRCEYRWGGLTGGTGRGGVCRRSFSSRCEYRWGGLTGGPGRGGVCRRSLSRSRSAGTTTVDCSPSPCVSDTSRTRDDTPTELFALYWRGILGPQLYVGITRGNLDTLLYVGLRY